MEKEELIVQINKNLEFVLYNIDFGKQSIKIHINMNNNKDYPRSFFTLFTLSRLKKHNLLELEQRELVKFAEELYQKSLKENLKTLDRLTLQIYYMRFLNILNLDHKNILEKFKKEKYTEIYGHSVSMYLFCCLYTELDLKESWEYSESIFSNCIKNFDFLIFSNLKNSQPIFAFSEISSLNNFVPNYLTDEVNNFYTNLSNEKIVSSSSSGITKCLEHLGRVGDINNFKRYFEILNNRNISKINQEYINPNLLKFEPVFVENTDSQYICLDTNTHLINAYLNLYERES